MNGLCPACRRPYDEKTIQWKVVTQEEYVAQPPVSTCSVLTGSRMAEFRSNIQKNQKKRAAEQRQKEAQKREAERENRKNLVGVRVVQKNLVYVTGLTPTVREDELLKTLRTEKFFGQYGNIQKISISNRRGPEGQNPSVGVYVTFEKKEDAQRCIQAVNGSMNSERVLKAQLGTTKYCSTWLRNETCTNRQCMFLHEQGDEEDSYTRQDLSSMNSISTQRPLPSGGSSSRSASRQQMQPQQPQQPQQPSQVAPQAMARSSSKDGSENDDASALPSSASWARNPQVQARSRRGSHATSGAASSPAISTSLPVTAEAAESAESAILEEPTEIPTPPTEETAVPTPAPSEAPAPTEQDPREAVFARLFKAMSDCPFPRFPQRDQAYWDQYPPLFDPRGGEKRRAMREEEENRLAEEQEEQIDVPDLSEGEPESSGSLALGGEPEDREHGRETRASAQRRGSVPVHARQEGQLGGAAAYGFNYGSIGNRSAAPPAPFRSQGSFAEHLPPGISSQSNLFQGQGGHSRQSSSRFNFAGENASNTTSVKLAANPRIMAQQSSMMPPALHSQQSNAYYSASMPGPPPGLKSTGTPPSMFGHSFGGAPGFGSGASKDNGQLLQDIIRTRGQASGQAHDAGKREYPLSSFSHQYPPSTSSSPAPAAPGFSASLYGAPPGAFQDFGAKQKKKGKKHRHANTSSSGGSALVDLADPSILRMQHQQSGAGVGQGLFGGQAQGGYNPSMMYGGGGSGGGGGYRGW